ncbi:hypothetical protein [Alteromonas sp. 14N.309.X.WAT.G.H12]|uniref:hypothetical protein n=1 Tax=Alteromonas sp. 14N.309.X.WAT.G.H12 TaxID=3120824 RepID=UPI002FD6A358
MIRTFTASPVKITTANFDMVGGGTGVQRHGLGMYFGSPDVVENYFENYRHYKEADEYAYFGNHMFEAGSVEFGILSALKQEQPINNLDLSSINNALNEDLQSNSDALEIEIRHGVVHNVELPNIRIEETPDWDDYIHDEEKLMSLQMSFLTCFYREKGVLSLDYDAMNLESNYSPEEIADLLDDMFYEAYSESLENGLSFYSSEDQVRRVWDYIILGNEGEAPELYDDFIEKMPELYENALNDIVLHGLNLTPDSITYGDLVQQVQSAFSIMGKENPGLETARFLSKNKIPALTGDAHHVLGKELVVYDEEVLSQAKFEPMTINEFQTALFVARELVDEPEHKPEQRYRFR